MGEEWPVYGFRSEDAPGRATTIISAHPRVVRDPKAEKRRAWEGFKFTSWGTGRPEVLESVTDFLGLEPDEEP